jgi:hypothetical protein
MGGFPHCIERNHMLHWWWQLSELSDLHECPEQGNSYCCLEPWPMIEMRKYHSLNSPSYPRRAQYPQPEVGA